MAVANTLQAKALPDKKVTFKASGQDVELSPSIVRNYLVSGSGKDRISDQEIALFINLCKYQGLNPWTREAYCIKYGNESATLVTGKDAFMRRAEEQPNFDGCRAGVVVINESGEVIYRDGALKLPTEKLVGGWAEVFVKDRSQSMRQEVSFDEYVVRKSDGTINAQWTKRPATMIRKVALVQAIREAFSKCLQGMYVAEEFGEVEPVQVMNNIPEPEGPIVNAEIIPQNYTIDDLPAEDEELL